MISTGSSIRARGGGWPASARCSSRRKTTICAHGSRTRSRWLRSPRASPAQPTCAFPLVEAIALAHDCGHGPAGHASEEAFSPYLPGTGYDHAVYGADVTLAGLNLCRETLDGVRNHSWRRPSPSTPEGEVVAWADRIAYVCHDFEDAVRARHPRAERPPRRGARRRRHRAIRAGRYVRARCARRHRPRRTRRHDRARGLRARGIPRVQLRADLSSARGATAGRACDSPAQRPRRPLRRRAAPDAAGARRRGRGPRAGITGGGRARGALREWDDRPLRARPRCRPPRVAARRSCLAVCELPP